MAARPVYLDANDLKGANALFVAAFGKNPKQQLEEDQVDVVEETTFEYETQFAEKMNVRVGKFRADDYEGPKTPLIRRHMGFAQSAYFSTDKIAGSLLPVARYVYAFLKMHPSRRTGFFGARVVYLVNGRQKSQLTLKDIEDRGTVVTVASQAEYAGVLDSPDATPTGRPWPRPTWKAFLAARRRFGKGVDIRYRYINSDRIGNGPWGKVELGGGGYRVRPGRVYAVPVIDIADPGELRGAGLGPPLQRRPKKSRRYGQYEFRSEFRRKRRV